MLLSSCRSLDLRIANEYYEEFAYSRAIPKYEKVLTREYSHQAASRLAEAYQKTGDPLSAESWLRRVVDDENVTQEEKLAFAEVLMENGKYEEAGDWFRNYLQLSASDERAKNMLRACDSIHWFFQDTTAFSVNEAGFNRVNENNFSPAFYMNGIVFLSDRPRVGKRKGKNPWTGMGYLDLYYTTRIDESENWLEPEILNGDLNGLYDEGPAVFNSDFSRAYFTRTDYSGKNLNKNAENETIFKLFTARNDGDEWNVESELPFNNEDYSVGHPALSPDESTLFFVSDMPWGYGGTDIYSVTFVDGEWGEPVNLGSRVNSAGNEMFPFFAKDSALYFASDGHVGLGGLDVYETRFNGDFWDKPENLQYPVNSARDDFGFIIDSLNIQGYFTSNRTGRSDRIYTFIKHPPIINEVLYLNESGTGKPVLKFEGRILSPKSSEKIKSDKNGRLVLSLPEKTEVLIVAKAPGYFAVSRSRNTSDIRRSVAYTDTLRVDKIKMSQGMICPNIVFDKKSTELTDEIMKGLDSLKQVLLLNPELQVEIGSHTDSRGSYDSNLRVSRERSDELSLYLIENGIKAHRIISKGYGESRLLNHCRNGILCLEEDHMINNRVELKVVDIIDE
jgi:outer membrane protein OmpA-like peptidoglycan-associated protein/tetratricopeptide (TPR) repeat protein